MVVKVEEYFEKTRNVKNNDNFKKIYSMWAKKYKISWKKSI